MIVDDEASPLAHFGRSVALSADGLTADRRPGRRRARRGLGVHALRRDLDAAGSEADRRGESRRRPLRRTVALSADGEHGACRRPGRRRRTRRGLDVRALRLGVCQLGSKLPGAAETQGHFGSSLALSGRRHEALVGAPRVEAGLGIVDVFSARARLDRTAGARRQRSRRQGLSGASVALSGDGEVAAIGASRDDKRAGAAWVFSTEPASACAAADGHRRRTRSRAGRRGHERDDPRDRTSPKNPSREPVVMFGVDAGGGRGSAHRCGNPGRLARRAPKGTVHVTVATATGKSAETSRPTRFRYEAPGTRAGASRQLRRPAARPRLWPACWACRRARRARPAA